MNYKIVNKIGILINWTREIDIYDQLITNMNHDNFLLIVNNIKTFEPERKNNTKNIIKELEKKNIK